MSEQLSCQTPRHELTANALKHYDRISTQAGDYYSVIPQAIRLWMVTPDLKNTLVNVAQLLEGWHTDTAWSEWDEQVRKQVSEAIHLLESMS